MANTNPRAIDMTDVDAGSFLVWNGEDEEFGGVTPPAQPAAPSATPAAITGGEAPTEAEHNALRAAHDSLRTHVLALEAAMVANGFLTD